MAEFGDINGIYSYRCNPDTSSPFTHQYQVSRTERNEIEWESMEQILEIDDEFPMCKFCTNELISEYHQYIMQFVDETTQQQRNKQIMNENENKKQSKSKKKTLETNNMDNIFVARYDVEEILDEKQDNDDDEILFKIRWKGWPSQYDSWTLSSNLDENSQKLVSEFRRNNINKQGLGGKGFVSNYWKKLYAKEWKEYMDGMDNAMDHAEYAYSFFKKHHIEKEIINIADFGFGFGKMLEAFVKKFRPKLAYGLEPSSFAFHSFTNNFDKKCNENKTYFKNCHLHLECIDLNGYFNRESMTMDQVEKYNKFYKQKKSKKSKKMNKNDNSMEIDDDEDDVDMINPNDDKLNDILNNNRNYKEFCFCSRGKNRAYYKRKQDKLNNNKKLKRSKKMKSTSTKLLSVYDEFKCACLQKFDGSYNLGVCVSVLQYLNDIDVENVLKQLSYHCDFLYFDVVTKEEYDIMSNGGSTFRDEWAISRPRDFYWKIIFKYWRIVSNEILESKYFYPDIKSSNIPNTIYVINNIP